MKKIYSLLLLFVCALQGIRANQEAAYYGNQEPQETYVQNSSYQPVPAKKNVWKVVGQICALVGTLVIGILIGWLVIPYLAGKFPRNSEQREQQFD